MVCDVGLKENIMTLTVGNFRRAAENADKPLNATVSKERQGEKHKLGDLNVQQIIDDIQCFINDNQGKLNTVSKLLEHFYTNPDDNNGLHKLLGTKVGEQTRFQIYTIQNTEASLTLDNFSQTIGHDLFQFIKNEKQAIIDRAENFGPMIDDDITLRDLGRAEDFEEILENYQTMSISNSNALTSH